MQIIDYSGRNVYSTLPDPFAVLELSVTQTTQAPGTTENETDGGSSKDQPDKQRRPAATGHYAVGDTKDAVSVCIRPPVYLRPAVPNDGSAFAETRSGFKRRIERNSSMWAILEDAEGPVLLFYARAQSEVHFKLAHGRKRSSLSALAEDKSQRYHGQASAIKPPVLCESSGVDEPQASPLHLSIYASSDLSLVELD